jgi:hypothetical protein
MQRLSRGWLVPGALLAAGLAAYPAITQQAAPLVVCLGGLAVALFVAGQALPLPSVLAWALGLLAIEYLAALQLRSAGLDLTAPAYAAAFFLCAELGWLGLEARRGGRLWSGRAVAVVSLAVAGAVLGALVLLLAAVQMAGGALLTGVGVAAAVAVAACLAWLARRQP